jgi:RNA polymerase sigma-70 factor (ECF subfamily)
LSEKNIIQNQIELAKNNNQNAFSFLLNMFWDDVYKFQLKRGWIKIPPLFWI